MQQKKGTPHLEYMQSLRNIIYEMTAFANNCF